MKIMAIYIVLLQLLWCALLCGTTKQSSLDEMIAVKKIPASNLSCLVCHTELEKECLNFTQLSREYLNDSYSQQCDSNATMCMVRRFTFTVAPVGEQKYIHETFAIKRNCSSNCEPGCVILGERTKLYVCNSCCPNSNCNLDNGAESELFAFKLSWVLFSLPISLALI